MKSTKEAFEHKEIGSMLKYYLSVYLFLLITTSTEAKAVQAEEAYACENCNSLRAEYIAIRNAPKNDCDIYRNGLAASVCEPISKDILVAVHQSGEIFKYQVTTSIDLQNYPVVSLVSSPLTSRQRALMKQYLNFNNMLVDAVHDATITSAELHSQPFSLNNGYTSTNDSHYESCESHPTAYFSSPINAQQIENQISNRISNHFDGQSAVDISYDRLFSGGGIAIGVGNASINVNLNYIERNLIVFRGTDLTNRLAFDVSVAGDVNRPNFAAFNLTLNKAFTSVDGFQYAALFGGGQVDLSGAIMSNCLLEFLEQQGESNATPENGGGLGSYNDPFVGTDALDNTNTLMFCQYTRKVTTCHKTSDGAKSCNTTQATWVDTCGR